MQEGVEVYQDILAALTSQGWLLLTQLSTLLHDNALAIFMAGLLFTICVLVDTVGRTKKSLRKSVGRENLLISLLLTGEKVMNLRGKRGKEVNRIAADCITDALEDAEHRGILSRDEKMYLYQKLANFFSISDLLSKGQNLLKEELRKRRAARTDEEKRPLPLPGDNVIAVGPDRNNKLQVLKRKTKAA